MAVAMPAEGLNDHVVADLAKMGLCRRDDVTPLYEGWVTIECSREKTGYAVGCLIPSSTQTH